MDEWIDSFLDYMAVERGVSPHTLSAYRNDLRQLVEFLRSRQAGAGERQAWEAVDEQTVSGYLMWLHELGYSDTTRARKVASAKSLFGFLVDEGLLARDPTGNLSSPRVGRSLPDAISMEQVEALLAATGDDTPEAMRDHVMLELLYATGMRVSELVSLDLDDVDLEQGYVRCFGKGSKERLVPIHERAVAALRCYIDSAWPSLAGEKSGSAIFLNRRGKRLTRQGLWLILKGYAARAGIEAPVTPHTLRHSFATHLLRGGAPLRHVQDLLGHASITTTRVYTHLTTEHVRAEYDKAHPRARKVEADVTGHLESAAG